MSRRQNRRKRENDKRKKSLSGGLFIGQDLNESVPSDEELRAIAEKQAKNPVNAIYEILLLNRDLSRRISAQSDRIDTLISSTPSTANLVSGITANLLKSWNVNDGDAAMKKFAEIVTDMLLPKVVVEMSAKFVNIPVKEELPVYPKTPKWESLDDETPPEIVELEAIRKASDRSVESKTTTHVEEPKVAELQFKKIYVRNTQDDFERMLTEGNLIASIQKRSTLPDDEKIKLCKYVRTKANGNSVSWLLRENGYSQSQMNIYYSVSKKLLSESRT